MTIEQEGLIFAGAAYGFSARYLALKVLKRRSDKHVRRVFKLLERHDIRLGDYRNGLNTEGKQVWLVAVARVKHDKKRRRAA